MHRLFGAGKVPRSAAAALEAEGILLRDEGIRVTVTYRDVRGPARHFSRRRQWFTGSIVVTRVRIAAFALRRPLLNLPLDDERMRRVTWTVTDGGDLQAVFDASLAGSGWSGSIEYRFGTALAAAFAGRLGAGTGGR